VGGQGEDAGMTTKQKQIPFGNDKQKGTPLIAMLLR
jgi:hypothetical protein